MGPDEVAGLLAYASALDPRVRRTEPEQRRAQVVAWSTLLQDVGLDAARAAVAAHYSRAGVDAVLPGDVRAGVRGSDTDRHPAYRPLREAVEAADVAAGGTRMPALPAGPEARAAAQEARARLAEALDLVAAKRVIPPDGSTGYVPKRQRGPVRRDVTRRLPATDRSGRALTVCHCCACDIPVPAGWSATDPDGPRLYCDPCSDEPGVAP